MGLFAKFFDTAAVDRFVDGVVGEVVSTLPPQQVVASTAKTKQRREQLDRRMAERMRALRAEQRLNVYQKAKLGTRLQDALKERNYPDAFCKDFAYDVVTRLAALAEGPPRR